MNNNKFIKKWERGRKKGKTVYILLSCLTLGASTLLGAFIGYLITGRIAFDTTTGLVIGGLIGGLIGGALRWNSNEEKFKELTGHDSDINH